MREMRRKDRLVADFEKIKEVIKSCEILRLGLFDEEFFASLEDVDLGYRARLLGYRNVFAPEAKVLHVGSGASGSRYNSFNFLNAGKESIILFLFTQYAILTYPLIPKESLGTSIKSYLRAFLQKATASSSNALTNR